MNVKQLCPHCACITDESNKLQGLAKGLPAAVLADRSEQLLQCMLRLVRFRSDVHTTI